MADVFVSYARESELLARRIAEGLTAAGYDVWWDSKLLPHHSYAELIEREVRGAKAVLVVWSEHAIGSQWVRAEADLGRALGRLVQVTADRCAIPLPFNQYQTVKLGDWEGDVSDPRWLKVLASVAALTGRAQDQPNAAPAVTEPARLATSAKRKTGGRPGNHRLGWIAGGIASALLVAGGAWFAWSGLSGKTSTVGSARVAILPFETLSGSAEAKFFAAGLGDQILTTLSDNKIPVVSRDDAAGLRGPDRAAKLKALDIGLIFDGTVQSDGSAIKASVHVEDAASHATLWSGGVEGPVQTGPSLQKRMADTAVSVLACSNRALKPVDGLRDPALLSRYLRACDLFTNQASGPEAIFELLADLRKVSAGAPRFAAAHSDLAKFAAYLAPLMPPEQAAQMRAEAAREAKLALQVEPRSPDAYLAQEMLLPETAWAERERLLRKGVEMDPDWPHTNGFLGKLLAELGRLKEAQVYGERASAADLQIDWRVSSADIKCIGGKIDESIGPLKQAVIDHPGDQSAPWLLAACLPEAHRYAEARDALLPVRSAPSAQAITLALTALESRKSGDLAAARQALDALAAGGKVIDLPWAINLLAGLGFLDDAFKAAERYVPDRPTTGGESTFLFRPIAAPLRRDPRFMQLAARIGLAQYWKVSGKWPDFCAEPGLPYDCRKEAARWIKP